MPSRKRLLIAALVSMLLAALVVVGVRSLREETAVGEEAAQAEDRSSAASLAAAL